MIFVYKTWIRTKKTDRRYVSYDGWIYSPNSTLRMKYGGWFLFGLIPLTKELLKEEYE